MAARTTDGVHPATRQNRADMGMSTRAVSRRLAPSRSATSPARKARCIPDTATVWDRPVRWREVVKGSVRLSRFPVTSAFTSGAASPGKLRSMLSFSALDHRAGLSRSGTASGRSQLSRPYL